MKFATPAATSKFLAVLSLSVAAATVASAQSVVTDPVGFLNITCTANSDTIVSVPMTQPPAFVGAIASVSGSTITLSGTLPGSYGYNTAQTPATPAYYALIGPNPVSLAGTVSTGSGSPVVTGAGTNFTSSVSVGDGIIISGSSTTYSIVQSVDSNTQLTLTIPYGVTLSGVSASVSHATPAEGNYYTIVGSGSNTLTVNTNGDTTMFPNIQANTQVSIIPYWTLTTVFPDSAANISYTPSTSQKPQNHQTEILLMDNTSAGINLAPSVSYYYINQSGTNVGWRMSGDASTTSHANDILAPNTYFIVRNQNSATTGILTLTGNVITKRILVQIDTQASSRQDNSIGIARPVDIPLNAIGLSPNNGTFTASTSSKPQNLQDQILVFNPGSTGYNISPSYTYYYINQSGTNVGWRLGGDANTTDHGADTIKAGSGIIIQKVASGSGATVFVPNAPTY